ncbi:MAG: hypothetical protein KDE08_17370 [Rhodobacteraceae bacterium]|nr:hypothetical protein [Paracoccaceae bacterium]
MPLHLPRNLGERYSPLYFLASLGAGGLSVTFFLYLMFWVPHPGQPVPVFEDILKALQTGGPATQAMIILAWAGIAYFSVTMIRLLVWNLLELRAFRQTKAYETLRSGNAETQLLAIPLALAMAVNGGFILGLVFVPGLWGIVEYLFPLAILAFLAIGGWALAMLGDFFGRVLTKGGFDCAKNNSFAQLLPAFALAMVGVGLAAPAAMSTLPLTAGISYIASTFFVVTATLLGAVKLILGFRAMMENGAHDEGAPTLLVAIPFITVVSIAVIRQMHGLHVHFDAHAETSATFTLLTKLLVVQLAFGLLGLTVLRRQGYAGRFITGGEKSAGSYALVCPAVALSVMLQFYINKGLVAVDLIAKFSPAYWVLTVAAIGFQLTAIWLVARLNAKHFGTVGKGSLAVPAE